MPMYCGIGGVRKEIKNLYTGVGGVRKDITEMWAGNAGVKKQIFSSGTLLSELPVGSEVTLTESGFSEPYIVVNQGQPAGKDYDSSCDGVWLLRKFLCNDTVYWNNMAGGAYQYSQINNYLTTTYRSLLSSGLVNTLLMTPSIPYFYLYDNNYYSTDVFTLSMYEIGLTSNTGIPSEGSILDYFADGGYDRKIAYLDGRATQWWTRTENRRDGSKAWAITTYGNHTSVRKTRGGGVRPAIILKKDTIVSGDGSIVEG